MTNQTEPLTPGGHKAADEITTKETMMAMAMTTCPHCNGYGKYNLGSAYGDQTWVECRTCTGTGKVAVVPVPAREEE